MAPAPSPRSLIVAGARASTPLTLAVLPFGLVYGVAVTESTVSTLVGMSASWVILAGAAQLSLLSLIDDGAAWPLAVGTALVINARFALYSTALAPPFSAFPARWRYGLSYLITDQAASLALLHYRDEHDPDRRRWWFFGAAGFIVIGWSIGTIAGAALGGSLPDDLDIAFAVPAMFIALLVPSVTDRPALVAAAVGGAVTVLAAPFPNGLNILAGALAGIAAGRLVTRPATA
jgi:predicted branched-subunit amino acid permease